MEVKDRTKEIVNNIPSIIPIRNSTTPTVSHIIIILIH